MVRAARVAKTAGPRVKHGATVVFPCFMTATGPQADRLLSALRSQIRTLTGGLAGVSESLSYMPPHVSWRGYAHRPATPVASLIPAGAEAGFFSLGQWSKWSTPFHFRHARL